MAQAGVKFARIHGHIVPIKGKSGASKAPVKKAAPRPEKKLSTGTRVAFGVAALGAAALSAHMAVPLFKGAASYAGAKFANMGLKKAGKAMMQRGNIAGAQKLGTGFVHNIRVQRAAKTVMKHPLTMLGGVASALWGFNAYAFGKLAVTGGGNKPKKKAAPQVRSSV